MSGMTRMTGKNRVTTIFGIMGMTGLTGTTRITGMTGMNMVTGQTLTTRDCKGPQTNMSKNVGSIKT